MLDYRCISERVYVDINYKLPKGWFILYTSYEKCIIHLRVIQNVLIIKIQSGIQKKKINKNTDNSNIINCKRSVERNVRTGKRGWNLRGLEEV